MAPVLIAVRQYRHFDRSNQTCTQQGAAPAAAHTPQHHHPTTAADLDEVAGVPVQLRKHHHARLGQGDANLKVGRRPLGWEAWALDCTARSSCPGGRQAHPSGGSQAADGKQLPRLNRGSAERHTRGSPRRPAAHPGSGDGQQRGADVRVALEAVHRLLAPLVGHLGTGREGAGAWRITGVRWHQCRVMCMALSAVPLSEAIDQSGIPGKPSLSEVDSLPSSDSQPSARYH